MKNNIQNLTLTALMAAILCVAGPIVIPIGMVPMSFANMAIYLTIILLDKKRAVISVAIYLLIGLVGLPVFSGFTGGVGKLFGPTGGYLIGYLAVCWIAGMILEKRSFVKKENVPDKEDGRIGKSTNTAKMIKQILALAVGTLSLYMIGTVWLMYQSNLTFIAALSVGAFPFIPFDIVKIIAACLLGKSIQERIAPIR